MFFLLLNLWFSTPSFAGPSAFNEEANFFSIIVGFRTQLKLSPLLTDDRLMTAASKHAQWMAYKRILTHIGPALQDLVHPEFILRVYLVEHWWARTLQGVLILLLKPSSSGFFHPIT